MQNRYAGDVGDYAKFVLLYELIKNSSSNIVIGLNWYLSTDETHNLDGKHVGYLKLPRDEKNEYCLCSPVVYSKLARIGLKPSRRNIRGLEKSKILPENTIYHNKLLSYERLQGKENRLKYRKKWVAAAFEKLKPADIIFFDQDNGIEVKSVKKTDLKAVKYCFHDEYSDCFKDGKSIILYNHRNRQPAVANKNRILEIYKILPGLKKIKVLTFHRGSARDFIILSQDRHVSLFNRTIASLTKEKWEGMFTNYSVGYKKS
jgi:hypothetical protein